MENSKTFIADLRSLLSFLQNDNETGSFFEYGHDLLTMAYTEFVGSNRYTELNPERRKELFSQYDGLRFLLNELDVFTRKYPDDDAVKIEGTYSEKTTGIINQN